MLFAVLIIITIICSLIELEWVQNVKLSESLEFMCMCQKHVPNPPDGVAVIKT